MKKIPRVSCEKSALPMPGLNGTFQYEKLPPQLPQQQQLRCLFEAGHLQLKLPWPWPRRGSKDGRWDA